jgi:hypothetical protein
MNRPIAVAWVKIIRRPNETSTITIGISHHIFLFHRNSKSSVTIEKLDDIFSVIFIAYSLPFYRLSDENYGIVTKRLQFCNPSVVSLH